MCLALFHFIFFYFYYAHYAHYAQIALNRHKELCRAVQGVQGWSAHKKDPLSRGFSFSFLVLFILKAFTVLRFYDNPSVKHCGVFVRFGSTPSFLDVKGGFHILIHPSTISV